MHIMAEIQQTEQQTFRTEAQTHTTEREFNHNVLLTTEGQRDSLRHLFLSTWRSTTEHCFIYAGSKTWSKQ